MKPLLAIVTGTRAEYGIFRPLLTMLKQRGFAVQLYVTGSHLAPQHGMTVNELIADGNVPDETVDILMASDSPKATATAMALATMGFADVFRRRRPDLVFLLGDRYEVLAVAIAAQLCNIPVAHLHGGERTEGAVDEAFRHATTKMAHIHFVATDEYRRRVIQLGEASASVHTVGALGLDNLATTEWLSRDELETALDFRFRARNLLVTYHPQTLNPELSLQTCAALLKALDAFPDTGILLGLPNADPGRSAIADAISGFARQHADRVRLFESLGTQRYFSLLRHVDAVVGNSSSGLIEVPSFGIPTVNIGDRQKGRVAGPSVLHTGTDYREIESAIERALSDEMRKVAKTAENPYGNGGTAGRIADEIEKLSFPIGLQKSFNDLNGLSHIDEEQPAPRDTDRTAPKKIGAGQ